MQRLYYPLLMLLCLLIVPGKAYSAITGKTSITPYYTVTSFDAMTTNMLDIKRMFQDMSGFVWFAGSDGFYRFDGYEIKHMPSVLQDGTPLYNRSVDYLTKDYQGNVWCIIDANAYVFDTHTHIHHNVLELLSAKNHKKYAVRIIKPLLNGTVWIICDGGVAIRVNEKSPYSTAEEMFSLNKNIEGIDLEGQTIWVKTEDGNFIYKNGRITATKKSFQKHSFPTPFYVDRFGRAWNRSDLDAPYINDAKVVLKDMHDNVWYSHNRHLYLVSFNDTLYSTLQSDDGINRFSFIDKHGRLWVSHRSDKKVLIYNADKTLKGYLAPNGSISKSPVEFSSLVYVIYEDHCGNIWFATKPDGVYRLREKADGNYDICNFRMTDGLNDNEVIAITQDNSKRLWLCGFRNGLNCIEDLSAEKPVIKSVPCSVADQTTAQMKFRYIYVTKDNTLLVATVAGLIVYDLRQGIAPLLKGRNATLHSTDNKRQDGLNCNDIKKIFQASDGVIYLATQSGGVNVLLSKSIYDKTLRFAHYDTSTGFPTDYTKSIIESNGALWVTSQNSLIEWHPKKPMPEGACVRLTLDDNEFEDGMPVRCADGTWIYGTTQGCRTFSLKKFSQLCKDCKPYKLVLTSIADADTITLPSDTRSLSLTFSTLDFRNPSNINYAFCMLRDGKGEWQYIGKTHQISFQHLLPGEYILKLRSTDSNGVWLNNTRSILLKVTPVFWETWWAKLLYLIFFVFVVVIVYYAWRYIQRIKQQQREALDSYMMLLNHNKEEQKRRENHEEYRRKVIKEAKIEPYNDEFIKKVIAYVEANISNPDIDIEQLASEVCVSRSHLNHKLKQILGVTPLDIIREARIRHACNLLNDDSLSINQIAYSCGFTDPKYFSKCFKQSTGLTPSNYRLKL